MDYHGMQCLPDVGTLLRHIETAVLLGRVPTAPYVLDVEAPTPALRGMPSLLRAESRQFLLQVTDVRKEELVRNPTRAPFSAQVVELALRRLQFGFASPLLLANRLHLALFKLRQHSLGNVLVGLSRLFEVSGGRRV